MKRRVSCIGVNFRPPQATRKGWPYYTRRLHKPYDPFVSRRATPCGWPASRSHGLPLTLMRVSCEAFARREATGVWAILVFSSPLP